MATLPNIDLDVRRIEDVTRAVVRPEGVGPARFQYDFDHSGDRAMYIRFKVAKRPSLDRNRGRQLAVFADMVARKLYELGTGLFLRRV